MLCCGEENCAQFGGANSVCGSFPADSCNNTRHLSAAAATVADGFAHPPVHHNRIISIYYTIISIILLWK